MLRFRITSKKPSSQGAGSGHASGSGYRPAPVVVSETRYPPCSVKTMTKPLKPLNLLLLTLTLLCGCDTRAGRTAPPGPEELRVGSYQELEQDFQRRNYSWRNLTDGVPRIRLRQLPTNLDRLADVDRKKQLFFLSLLPMVLRQNEQIEQQRQQLLALLDGYDRFGRFDTDQQRWLDDLCRSYRCPLPFDASDANQRARLLRRVDSIPVELVLAQAANESGYGTSRFAIEANNLFGECTFEPGSGLIPKRRPAGASYEVRRFDSIGASIASYLNNLNSHPAYRNLRHKRAELRASGQPISGLVLASGLLNYSARREHYIREIRRMIEHNRLHLLADLSWRRRPGPLALGPQQLFPQRLLGSRPSLTARMSY